MFRFRSGNAFKARAKAFVIAAALLPILVICQASLAGAATFYIATNGNDFNPGTQAQPWATLQKAANTVGPGDVVEVSDGTYQGMQVNRSGTAGNPITFLAVGNVTLNVDNSGTPDIINIEGVDYIIIDGFRIHSSSRAGIRCVESTGCIIRNNVVGPNFRWAIFSGFATDILIEDNICFDSEDEHGIYVSNSSGPGDNPIIRGNECYGNRESGIQLNGDCFAGGDGYIDGALVENNYIHDNGWKGFSLISVRNSIFQNNIIVNNRVTAGAAGIHLTNEPGCNMPSIDNIIVNNTISEPRMAAIRATDDATANVIFNNLLISQSGTVIGDEVGGNIIDPVSNIESSSEAGYFLAAPSDYHLSATSPAIGGGVASFNIGTAPPADFDGDLRQGGIDIGADQQGGGGGPVDTTPPTAAMTAPASGSTVSGTITLSANASDDIGVIGVLFQANGNTTIGFEDFTAPYEASLSTSALGNGTHSITARARDAAGNTTTSTAISVTVSNAPPPPPGEGISAEHPRMFFTSEQLATIRAKACYDDFGNVIPNCTPSADWAEFEFLMGDGFYGQAGWHFALMYQVTGDPSYAQQALSWTNGAVAAVDDERGGSYLEVGHYMTNAAFVYDWCHDQLSASEKTMYLDYFRQLMIEIWNPFDNPYNTWSGWSINSPGNNYYWTFMCATALAGIASYGEMTNPPTMPFDGTTYTDMIEFVYAKLDNQGIPLLDGLGEGGGMHEGPYYGRRSKNFMFQMFLALRTAGARDYFAITDFARESVLNQLYLLQPGEFYFYPGGDTPRIAALPISGDDNQLMGLLAEGLRGTVEGQYAQQWLNWYKDQMQESLDWNFKKPWEALLYEPNAVARDFKNELPLSYTAPGTGFMNSRSSWDTDAVSVSFVSTDRVESHQHADQNSFVIFKDGWQAIDAGTYSQSGIYSYTHSQNTILVGGEQQRFGWGTGALVKSERGTGYAMVAGDASDAYWTNTGAFGSGDRKLTSNYTRELLHALPGYVFVYDRITLMDQNDTPSALLHTHNQPSVNGNMVMSSDGGGKLYQWTVEPQSHTLNAAHASNLSGDLSSWYVEMSPTSTSVNHFFLNVLFCTDANDSSIPTISRMTSEAGDMVGAQIDHNGERVVCMFSTDPSIDLQLPSTSFQLGMGETQNYLNNMIPNAEYAVNVTPLPSGYHVVVSLGEGHTSSPEGILEFKVNGGVVESSKMMATK